MIQENPDSASPRTTSEKDREWRGALERGARRVAAITGRFLAPYRRGIVIGGAVLVALIMLACLTVYLLVRGSLPTVSGSVHLPGLEGRVTVSRDRHGVPTILAPDELDAWRVLGFLEAQDRFFQMDLLRRSAAGRLSALLGPGTLALDRRHAIFDLGKRAETIYLESPAPERARLDAFTLGVNEGLAELSVRPWPYLLLHSEPFRWRPEDCILAIYAMAFTLEDPWGRRARSLAALRALYPRAAVRFLMAPDTDWATPMAGSVPQLPPIPGTSAVDLAAEATTAEAAATMAPAAAASGSNNFAVSGQYTPDGSALLANDMHLPLAVPPVWYRARLEYPSSGSGQAETVLTGVFLPGVPALVAGTNGHVAWGLTNSFGDWVDLIRVKPSGAGERSYLTPQGAEQLQTEKIPIAIRGERSRAVTVTRTIWGPVIGKTPSGDLLVSHWSLLQPGGVNLEYERLEGAQNVKEALAMATRAGIPPQNFLAVDSAGNIGWTIAGRIPARGAHCDYEVPESWVDGSCEWDGWLSSDAYPRITDPDGGYLVTANNRVDYSAAGDLVGDGGYIDGARAHQIAVDLAKLVAHGRVMPEELLRIQLDDRAKFLARWRDLVVHVLQNSALEYHPERRAFLAKVVHWGGRAAVGSVGYRLVRDFRDKVVQEVFGPILARLKSRYHNAELPFESQLEGPLWRLVVHRPRNWLNPRFPTWNALFLNAIDAVAARLWNKRYGLDDATWGRRNTVRVDNPLAKALGAFGAWLNMPVVQLPGDEYMPRVQAPTFGASMRLVAKPDAAADGIFELPGGQSDHPLSPWYADEFFAWARGETEPLAPGRPRVRMTFVPLPSSR